jgi:hypothetical protein
MEGTGHGYLRPIGYAGVAELNDVDTGAVAELIPHHLATLGLSHVRVFGGSADADGLAVIVRRRGRELRGRCAFRSAAARG